MGGDWKIDSVELSSKQGSLGTASASRGQRPGECCPLTQQPWRLGSEVGLGVRVTQLDSRPISEGL